MKKLFNPTSEDLEFFYDSAPYNVKAAGEETFVDYIAEQGAKKLADKNVITADEDEHKTLMKAYLDNISVEQSAESLGVDLVKIRKEAMTKEKEKARVINLEAQMIEMSKKIERLMNEKSEEPPKEEEKVKESNEKNFVCKKCNEEFNTVIELARHTKTHKE